MSDKEKVKEIIKRLSLAYPNPKTALHYNNPLQLLIATILSAQATDKVVNTVTPKLFETFKTARDFADAPLSLIDTYINRINFHNNKSKSIQKASKIIADKYNGIVPDTMADLDSLPGVARKTANVVLGQAFQKSEGIVVDTHVKRLSKKLGLTKHDDPVKIEQDLMKIVPRKNWIDLPLLFINFGRQYCPARKHVCKPCPLGDLCPD